MYGFATESLREVRGGLVYSQIKATLSTSRMEEFYIVLHGPGARYILGQGPHSSPVGGLHCDDSARNHAASHEFWINPKCAACPRCCVLRKLVIYIRVALLSYPSLVRPHVA